MNYKRLVLIFIFVLLAIAPASAWYQGYTYCQTHYMTASSNWTDNTTAVVSFDVSNGAGTSSGSWVYLANKSLNFPYDVAFTDANDNLLSRQIITISNASTTTYANIYVNITPYMKTGNTIINVYYGNTSAGINPDNGDFVFSIWENATTPYNSLYPARKFSGNPIISSEHAEEPSILKNGSTYWLYYDDRLTPKCRRMTGANEMSFSSPIDVLNPCIYPSVVWDINQYRMVYSGDNTLKTINLSSSYNGTNFNLQGKLLDVGSAGSWDSYAVYDPDEINVSGTHYLYYAARNGSSTTFGKIGLATSTTGLTGSYTKYGIVINYTTSGWGSAMVVDPNPIQYDTGKYIMFLSGYDGSTQSQGYATSTDLYNWTLYPGNPIEWRTQTSWELTPGPNEPDCLIEYGLYKCYYRGDATNDKIGYFNMTQGPDNLPVVSHKPWGTTLPSGTWTIGGGFLNQTDTASANHYISSAISKKNITMVSQMAHTSTTLNNELISRYDGSASQYETGPEGVPANVYLAKHATGFTSIANTASAQTQNVYYNYKLTAIGSQLYASKWNASSQEPSTPTLTGTDTTLANAGLVGLLSYGGSVSVTNIFGYDSHETVPAHSTWLSESTQPATVLPISASFTQSMNPSTVDQAVIFTDTSTGSPITWNWSVTGGSLTNSTQNAGYTYTTAGVYNVFLNVTNATGSWSNISQTHTVVNASGLSPQDVWQEQLLLQTWHITDSSTGLPIPVVNLQDTAMQTYVTTNGTGYLTETFGASNVVFTSTGYSPKSVSYFFDSEATHDVQLTPAATTPSQNTWYTPWQVRIRILDYYGMPLSNINVSANYVASTLPSTDTSWLVTAYGISSAVATDMVNSAKAMEGVTDDNGGLSFTMFKSIQYRLTITNSTLSVASTKTLYPSDQEYVIYVRTAGQTVANNTLAMRNGTLPWYSVNSTHINLNMTYVDTSLCTSQLVFRVWFRDNGTEVHNTTWSGFGAGYVYDNHTVPKAPIGTEYLWGYNATTVC